MGLFDELRAAYKSVRHYHNTDHVADCLTWFDTTRQFARHPAEFEAAIWFHDAIYDSRAKDNDLRSAPWAMQSLAEAGVASEIVERTGELILATKHDAIPESMHARLMIDIDLSILGRDPERFDRYDAAIRREYDWVPEEQYRIGRAAVLQPFIDRPELYSTAIFRDQFETAARENLMRAIRCLRVER